VPTGIRNPDSTFCSLVPKYEVILYLIGVSCLIINVPVPVRTPGSYGAPRIVTNLYCFLLATWFLWSPPYRHKSVLLSPCHLVLTEPPVSSQICTAVSLCTRIVVGMLHYRHNHCSSVHKTMRFVFGHPATYWYYFPHLHPVFKKCLPVVTISITFVQVVTTNSYIFFKCSTFWATGEVHTEFWLGNPDRKKLFGSIGVDGKTILNGFTRSVMGGMYWIDLARDGDR
jgi:hypothetical protein